jgi:hypothetical protein
LINFLPLYSAIIHEIAGRLYPPEFYTGLRGRMTKGTPSLHYAVNVHS